MRKTLMPLAIFIVFMAAVVFLERAFAPSFQECVAEKPANKEGGTPKENPSGFGSVIASYVTCTGRFIDSSGVGITALATMIIAAFTCTLWLATSRQAALTREALIADKRAFAYASGLNTNWEIDPTTNTYYWRLRPSWTNSGDTPVKNLRIYSACEIRNSILTNGFDFTQVTGTIGSGLLGPKFTMQGGAAPQFPNAAISPQDILDVQQGKKFIYLWGWARYHDVFPETSEHITRFCWAIFSIGNPLQFVPGTTPGQVGSLTFSYVNHMEGNCADEECDN